jgi:hypothetical protein
LEISAPDSGIDPNEPVSVAFASFWSLHSWAESTRLYKGTKNFQKGEQSMLPNQRTKTLVTKILITCLMASLVVASPTWGADKSKDEETLRNSAAVLKAMLDSDSVPKDVLARADCVIVLPSVKKAAFGVGEAAAVGP